MVFKKGHKTWLGKNHSEESKGKMSKALKGRKKAPFSEEHRRKISESLKGKKKSEETRRKMSEAAKGRKKSRL